MWVARAAFQFLFTPSGKIILVVLAFLAWTAYQRMDATRNCKDEQARVQLEEANRKLIEAQRIAEAARARADRSDAEIEQMGAERDAILSELETRGDVCAIPDDLRQRLRAIR